MKKFTVLYYASTGLLTALMVMSVSMYVLNYQDIAQAFSKLGYPAYLIYPLATAKILGLVAVWTNVIPRLAALAYAGFFYNFLLAAGAHIAIGDGQVGGALMALLFLGVSYWSRDKRAETHTRNPEHTVAAATV